MGTAPHILVDDRIGSKDLASSPYLSSPNFTTTLCRLPSADIAFAGNGPNDSTLMIGVEIKSIRDLVSSLRTGRIQDTQIRGMLSDYDVRWLLVYGEWRGDPGSGRLQIKVGKGWADYASSFGSRSSRQAVGTTPRAGRVGISPRAAVRPTPKSQVKPFSILRLDSLFFSLANLGVHTKTVSDKVQAAMWISELAHWWAKSWESHKSMELFDESRAVVRTMGMSETVYRRARVAAQLPNIGYRRALDVANHFGSIHEMVTAGAGEWESVEGVGPVIAEAVVRAIREG